MGSLSRRTHRWSTVRAFLAFSALALAVSTISVGVASAVNRSHHATAASYKPGFLACEVTDTGGINDRSFNASAWAGLQQAQKVDPTMKIQYLQSTSESDYVPNIQTFIGRHCGIIITVGFLMATATQNAAKAHPTQDFAIVDNEYVPAIHNVDALLYETNQDAFLGGFLAAAMSTTGKVGTFGGENIPTVTIYMDGWVAGVRYYDKEAHKHVVALGWTPKPGRAKGSLAGSGLFTNSFTNQADGNVDALSLIHQGADVIFPVAGSVGLGAAEAVKQNHGVSMEWVDTDGCVSDPSYCPLFMTSVEKGIVPSVENAALTAAQGKFKGGNYIGTLKNNGVGIAPYHDWASKIPASVQNGIKQIRLGIISGAISVDPNAYPAS
jgi:basic membrane protein A and related proteins